MSYQQQGYNQGYGQQNPYGQQGSYGQQGNPYGQTGGNQYGQSNLSPYASQGNTYQQQTSPYQQSGNPYEQRPGMQQQSSSRYDEESNQGYEMTPLNTSDPNRILNECREIDRAVDDLERKQQRLRSLHNQYFDAHGADDEKALSDEAETTMTDILQSYKELVARMKRIKSDKESGNPRNSSQVGRVDRKVKSSLNQCQQLERDFEHKKKDQLKRQYMVVRPNASEAEVQEYLESPNNTQVFSSALMQSNRRGEAQSTLNQVQTRHEAIQKIERDMIALAALYNDLDAIVVQQEAPVTRIEEQGEVVTEQVAKANTELDGAVKKARAARRKKWYCAGIVALIIIIIVVVVVVVVEVTKNH